MAHLESKKTWAIIFCLSLTIDILKSHGTTQEIFLLIMCHIFCELVLQLPRGSRKQYVAFSTSQGKYTVGKKRGEQKKAVPSFTFVSSAFFFMCILSKPLYFLWYRGGTHKKCDMMVKYELLGCPKGQLGLFMLILSIGMVMQVTELCRAFTFSFWGFLFSWMVINDCKNYFFAKVLKVEWWEYIFSKDQKLKSFHFLVFSFLPLAFTFLLCFSQRLFGIIL